MTARRALIVRGGWFGHEPVDTTEFMRKFLEKQGFSVDVHESPAVYADADYMAGVDLIVQAVTKSTIEKAELDGLRAAVAAGTGFAGWHGGIIDSYRNSADYMQLVGGQFAAHPGCDPADRTGEQSDNYRPHTIEITDLGRNDPIMAGVDDFVIDTEQYWVLSDPYMEVLATTTQPVREWDAWHEPVTTPSVWKRYWGQGRVFVSTSGHHLDVLAADPVRTITERGLLWAARH
ncbi:ThuA domain-containing protein [Microbacterium sp. NPDC019599]|uniref:ThuA domain-containing protein n=1 Tax=Microbacterium sp. NPDC019599 TaxID=3154690 RepID=UPI00340C6FF5